LSVTFFGSSAVVYRPTARVLTVLELLQAQGRMTGAALAARLEVDIRTVRHYIETLQDLGIPVEAERGRYGAYRLRPGFKLPPLIFTEDEALALTLSLLLARQSGLATAAPAVAGVLAKVERVLPATTRDRVQAMERTVIFASGASRVTPPAATVAALSAAVQAGQAVRLRYRSRGQETERAFDPYGIVEYWGYWYTIGYCHLREGERLFRLDRIVEIAPLDATFTRPPDFDPLAAVGQALTALPNAWQMEVWLGMPLEDAVRRIGQPRENFEEVADGVILRTGVEDLRETARHLAGLGVSLAIHRPPELRAALRDYALALARDAGRTGD
jgi:predicted DNA-binding transcriptional regulator YafY